MAYRCSCSRMSNVCPQARAGAEPDPEHDRLVAARAERAVAAGRAIDPCALKAARLWAEVAELRPDLLETAMRAWGLDAEADKLAEHKARI